MQGTVDVICALHCCSVAQDGRLRCLLQRSCVIILLALPLYHVHVVLLPAAAVLRPADSAAVLLL
jgi:hypothetical protein